LERSVPLGQESLVVWVSLFYLPDPSLAVWCFWFYLRLWHCFREGLLKESVWNACFLFFFFFYSRHCFGLGFAQGKWIKCLLCFCTVGLFESFCLSLQPLQPAYWFRVCSKIGSGSIQCLFSSFTYSRHASLGFLLDWKRIECTLSLEYNIWFEGLGFAELKVDRNAGCLSSENRHLILRV
jgi:hypothetical protein